MRAIAEAVAAELGREFAVGRTTRAEDVDRLVAAGASFDFGHLMNDAWETYSREGRFGDAAAAVSRVSETGF